MDNSHHPFHELFAQLGLPCDAQSIAQFIWRHSPLPGHVALADADFWTPAQPHSCVKLGKKTPTGPIRSTI